MKIVFDIGGSRCRVALADANGVREVTSVPTNPSKHGYEEFVEVLRSLSGNQQLDGIAGGISGQFDAAGCFNGGRNLPLWKGWAMQRALAKAFDCPVEIRNDVVMCGIGEAWKGAGTTSETMSYVTVSTGVNAVRLLGGLPDDTISHYELGYQLVSGGSTQTASLEELIGGAALEQRRGLPPGEIPDPALWIQEASYLARAIHNMRLYWDPHVIVVGGTMMRDIHLEVVREALKTFAAPELTMPIIRAAKLGDRAGLEGAWVVAFSPDI